MTCGRCSGMMLPELATDLSGPRITLLACVNCGDRLDNVILSHRLCRPDADRINNLHKAPLVTG